MGELWLIGVSMKSLTTSPTVLVTRYRRIPTMPAGKYALVSSKLKSHRVPGRSYQAVRDPERLLVEERAKALSAKGYPLQLDDDSASFCPSNPESTSSSNTLISRAESQLALRPICA